MSIYSEIAKLEESGEAAVLCTIVEAKGSTPRHEGSKMLVYPDGHFIGTVGGGEIESRVIAEAKESLESRKAKVLHYNLVSPDKGDPGICGGQVEVYVEPIIPKLTIVVVGAGHVGKQLVFLAKWLGYRVVVSDDRKEFCTPEAMPGADLYIPGNMADIPELLKINPFTCVVLTTRGADIDIAGLNPILMSEAGYIGVIGSRRRWEATKKGIIANGGNPENFSKVYTPVGLDLKAETPEEIAISIMAEIMMVMNGASGKNLKFR